MQSSGVVTNTNRYGLHIYDSNNASSTATNTYGIYVEEDAWGTIGTHYGLYLKSRANATTSYGIYQETAGDKNYFAGKVGIGTTAPATALDLNGSASYRGIAAPAVSPAGQGRVYFDSTSNTFKISQNGGAYADILTSATATGDITDVVAGAGLTGGAASGSATVNVIAGTGIVVNADDVAVDVGTTVGKIVQVQTGGKLPALDGSDLTNLDAGDIATGTLPIARGGTGQVTANAALNALLPTQATNSGKVLSTDGTNTSWIAAATGTVTSVTSANSYLSIATTTTTPVITANVGTAANTLAAGNDSRITGALQTTAYNADVLPAASCTATQTAYWNTVADTWLCQNINVTTAGGFIKDGGNSFGAAATVGTNDTFDLNFETGGTTQMTVLASTGNVGIGTTGARSKLDVNGSILSKASVANASSTIDFGGGNIQHTTASCGSFILHNLKDGGSFTFIVKGTTVTTCSFTAFSDAGTTALTVHLPPDHGATTSAKHTIYSAIVSGGDVYFAWIPGY